jgi:hypothetical protein
MPSQFAVIIAELKSQQTAHYQNFTYLLTTAEQWLLSLEKSKYSHLQCFHQEHITVPSSWQSEDKGKGVPVSRPWKALGDPVGQGSRYSWLSALKWWQGCHPHAPAVFIPRSILILIFRGWVDPSAHGSTGGYGKNPQQHHWGSWQSEGPK